MRYNTFGKAPFRSDRNFRFFYLILFWSFCLSAIIHRPWEWWRAYYHFVRPHAALRMPLLHPQARGGNRLAQRYRQRTPAMMAGRTTRRWTAPEVLSYPLPNVPGLKQGARMH